MLSANTASLYEFSIVQCGVVAWPLLQHRNHGRVAAVFDSSFYIEIDGKLSCVVGSHVPAGPINLVTRLPKSMCWRSCGLDVGAFVCVTGSRLLIGQSFCFDATTATRWEPSPPPENWNNCTLRTGLTCLKGLIGARAPTAGLARPMQLEPENCARVGLSHPSIAQLRSARRSLISAFEAPDNGAITDYGAICDLVGVGGGLTPSGDDFIGGVMLALRAVGYNQVCECIRDAVVPIALRDTNRISLEHLRCASGGLASKPIHEFVHAILTGHGADMSRLADEIEQIGHTSGWDIVAGTACTLEAILNHRDKDSELIRLGTSEQDY